MNLFLFIPLPDLASFFVLDRLLQHYDNLFVYFSSHNNATLTFAPFTSC